MNKFILNIIIAIYCSLNIHYITAQEIIESSTIVDVLPLVDEETWVLVDLDNTVFQAAQALGHVNWLQNEVQKLTDEGKTREEAFYTLYPLWKKTQMMTDVIPVESSFIEAIKELQNKNIVVMGLTHRQLFVVPETLRQLDSIDVSFQKSAPSEEEFYLSAIKQPALYTQGILFVDDFNTKGDVFRTLLQTLNQKPKKIIFIDDKMKNVEELAEAASLEEIDYIGVHYTAVEHGIQIYSPELAEVQLKFLNIIMSNEQAQHHLLIIENQEIKMIPSSTPEYLYKIVSPEMWQKSLLQNQIERTSIDIDFIHLSTENQVDFVVQKFWSNMDFLLLKLDSKKLEGRLVYEPNPGKDTKFYHLYEGRIPLDAVADVKVINNQ